MYPGLEQNKKIKLGYTLGDLGGIGPEIFYKFQKANKENPLFELILVDDYLDFNLDSIPKCKASAQAGEHAFRVLEKANELATEKEIDALITGPVAKESLSLAGINLSGQTEILARLNNLDKDEIEMLFILDEFRVVLATRHVPVNQIARDLERRLASVINNGIEALENIFNIKESNIVVAGLNPHAGENGLIGREENDFIKPLIDSQNHKYHKVHGPLPADTLFANVAHKYLNNQSLAYDLYIAAYHDQVLSLVKGIGGFRAINLTSGLPYIRASVDHGTAYDIVNLGIASSDGLKACTEFCLKYVKTAYVAS